MHPGDGSRQALTIRVLGDFEVLKGTVRQELPHSRKTRALLAYLVLSGRRHRRERLCDLFWDVPDDPRASLRWSLSHLRSLVDDTGCSRIVADREHVYFDPHGAIVDLFDIRREFTGGANALSTERLLHLAEVFRGELLEGLTVSDHRDFEGWLLTEREGARRTRASLLQALANRLCVEGRAEALRCAWDLVSVDPLSVSAHATLIRVLCSTGHREDAVRQHQISTSQLREAGEPNLEALNSALEMNRSATGPVSSEREPAVQLEQQIRFCSASDGVRIAFATVGQGPPLLKTANWLNHLEYDWDSPIWRHVFRRLGRDHRFIRYDARGNGLSDWDVEDISFEAFVRDLESVVDAAGLDRFPLLGISQGCAISIEYAIRNPGRVTRLVLHGGWARGRRVGADAEGIAQLDALHTLTLHGWGQDNPAFRQIFTSSFIPEGTPEQVRWMNELMRITTSPQNAVRLRRALDTVDIRDRLHLVQVPTLVLHSRNDAGIPYEKGLELAHGIPNARLITLESNNHLLLEHEPEFPRFMDAICAFLNEK